MGYLQPPALPAPGQDVRDRQGQRPARGAGHRSDRRAGRLTPSPTRTARLPLPGRTTKHDQEDRVVRYPVAQVWPVALRAQRDPPSPHQHPFPPEQLLLGEPARGLRGTLPIPPRSAAARRLRRQQLQTAIAGRAHDQRHLRRHPAPHPHSVKRAIGQHHHPLRGAASRRELLPHPRDARQPNLPFVRLCITHNAIGAICVYHQGVSQPVLV